MMDDISRAATMEFRPKIGEIGFPPPSPSDPREKKPKADDPDYSQKLLAHEAFNFERDVYTEISHVRDDFSLLVNLTGRISSPISRRTPRTRKSAVNTWFEHLKDTGSMTRPCVNLSTGPISLLVPIGSSRRKKRKTLSPASRG